MSAAQRISQRAGERARVLIIEPHSSGHHSTYLRWVVEAVTERGWTAVVVTTAEALEHPLLASLVEMPHVELRTRHAKFPSGVTSNRVHIIRRELVYWRAIRAIVRTELARGPLTAVVLPYLDYCFFACGVLGVPWAGLPWHVVSMRVSVLEGQSEGGVHWKWRLLRRLLSARSLRTLFSINPSVRRPPPGWLDAQALAKLRYLPDPAEYRGTVDRSAARAALGLKASQLAVLVFGTIDERKGLGRVAAALAADAALGSYMLVVAGKQSAAIQESLAHGPLAELRSQRRLVTLDRVLDDAEQAQVFAAADVVWLGYESHTYMSGVLVLAGHARLPVVVADEGEIAEFVRAHDCGTLVEVAGTSTVCDALRRLHDEPARDELGRRLQAAVADHTPDNFKRELVAAIAASG